MKFLMAALAIASVHCVNFQRLKQTPPVQKNFVIEPYLGDWYAIALYVPCSWSGAKQFTDYFTSYQPGPIAGALTITISWRSSRCATTQNDYIPQGVPGVFFLKDSFGDVITSESYIVATDYKRFVVKWGCTRRLADGHCSDPYVLVKTRHPNPSRDTLKLVQNILYDLFELNLSEMTQYPQGRHVSRPEEGGPSAEPSVSNGQGVCCSTSSICRICQLSRNETTEILEPSRCSCKGSLAKVHRQCLERWVQYRGSNLCEICGKRFVSIANPITRRHSDPLETLLPTPTPPDTFYFQTLETIRLQLLQVQPINRRKRTAIVGFLVFLLMVTAVTAVLTVGASQDFRKANNNPWSSDTELRKSRIVFAICFSFLFFCITLTVGLTLMWIVIEFYFYFRRRQIYRDAAERLLNNSANL